MNSHVNQAIQTFLDVWNSGDVDTLDDALGPTFVLHLPPYGKVMGVESMKEYVIALRSALPDFHVWTTEIIADQDSMAVAVRWKYHATHTGQSYTFPYAPTGKELEVAGCSIIHTVEGKIADIWHLVDNLSLLQQLEVIPVGVLA